MSGLRQLAVLLAMVLASCGYHVAGKADLLPKTIQTVCVAPFGNSTTRYKLNDRLPEAISRELIARTHYHISSNCGTADAVLKGSVLNYVSSTTVIDPTTSRASSVDVRVFMLVNLTERSTGKVLFSRPNMEIRERYQVSLTEGPYFDESDAALNRASNQVAQQVVAAILDNF